MENEDDVELLEDGGVHSNKMLERVKERLFSALRQ